MVDPLSISSGVAGLLSLGIQVTQSLIDFYSAYKDQATELAKITKHLENLLGIFRSLDGALQNRRPRTDALEILRQIDDVTRGCHEIVDELKAECQKFYEVTTTGIRGQIQVAGRRVVYPFRRSTLQKLDEDIAVVRETISLALGVLQVQSHSELSEDVSDLKKLLERTSAVQLSHAIRDWLKAPDAIIQHQTLYAKRHTGTGLWLIQGQDFQNWLRERNSFLWINGFAGSGKSVLCSTAIQYTFREKQHNPDVGVGFFYFSFNDDSKRSCSDGGKYLQQLHTSYPSGAPPVTSLLDCLQKIICRFNTCYLLLDAVDECPRDLEREDVLKVIETIQKWFLPGLHFFVTSRDELDIRQALRGIYKQIIISMRNPGNDKDIVEFISDQLSNDPKLGRWAKRHTEIREKLTRKAQGIFRYVECQFIALRRARNQNQLDECLRSLPRDLDETYQRILCSIDETYIEDVQRFLTVLCAANRPLTVKELVHAHAIDLRDSPFLDRGRVFEEEDDIVDVCRGLIEITTNDDEQKHQNRIARLAHFSVREYLESERVVQAKTSKFAIQKECANAEMAQIYLAYLLEPTLSIGVLDEKKLADFPLAHLASMQWFRHYLNSGEGKHDIEHLILKLFKDEMQSFVTWVRLHDMDRAWDTEIRHKRPVNDIASTHYYTALLGLDNILNALIMSWQGDNRIRDSVGETNATFGNALQAASYGGFGKMVQILLDHDADINCHGGYYGTALQAASSQGYESLVLLLLEHDADVNARCGYYGTALQAASYGGFEKVVQILIGRGADINAQGGYHGTALQAASYYGHEKVVQILLDHYAEVDARGGEYGTALQAASARGHGTVAWMLLDRGADVNAQSGFFGNALYIASARGHEKAVQILLDHGADINAQGGFFGTSLQAASSRGHEKLVQMLLDHGADVNAHGGEYSNALQAASSEGHAKIVQTLLNHGASLDAQIKEHGTALQAASSGGYEKVVQILLNHGANLHSQGGYYNTALQAASSEGHENVVQILLDHGADVNARGGPVGTALQVASSKSHEKAVQTLLEL